MKTLKIDKNSLEISKSTSNLTIDESLESGKMILRIKEGKTEVTFTLDKLDIEAIKECLK